MVHVCARRSELPPPICHFKLKPWLFLLVGGNNNFCLKLWIRCNFSGQTIYKFSKIHLTLWHHHYYILQYRVKDYVTERAELKLSDYYIHFLSGNDSILHWRLLLYMYIYYIYNVYNYIHIYINIWGDAFTPILMQYWWCHNDVVLKVELGVW